jgi:hypothetical protein
MLEATRIAIGASGKASGLFDSEIIRQAHTLFQIEYTEAT